MARKSDLAGFLRGLEYITRALVETQGPEVKQVWRNSSLKTAAEQVLAKSQRVVQDVTSNQSNIPVLQRKST
jgi:uncharacterized membrane protein required for colicin V production